MLVIVAIVAMAMPVAPRPAHDAIDEQRANGIASRDDHDDDTRHVRPRDSESDRYTNPCLRRSRGHSERGHQSDYQSDLSHRSPPERRPVGRVVPHQEATA